MKKWNRIIVMLLLLGMLVSFVGVHAWADHDPQGDYETPEVPIWGPASGDANDDGSVNALDVILLRQHLAGWDVEISSAGADANGDGAINALDVILLRQYLAGWNVELGK